MGPSLGVGRCFRIRNRFYVLLLLGLVAKLVAIDVTFGFGAASYVTGECPPTTCARGRLQLVDCCDDAASRFGWSVYVAINCSGSPCRVGSGCHRPFFLFCPTQEVSVAAAGLLRAKH